MNKKHKFVPSINTSNIPSVPSTNVPSKVPSVQLLNETLHQYSKQNPTLTSELCHLIVDTLNSPNTSHDMADVTEALERMGTSDTEITMNDTECSFPKMLPYDWNDRNFKSNEVIPLPENHSDDRVKMINQRTSQAILSSVVDKPIHRKIHHMHVQFDEDEKVDKHVKGSTNPEIIDETNGSGDDQEMSIDSITRKSPLNTTPKHVYNPFNTFGLIGSPSATTDNGTTSFRFSPRNNGNKPK